MTVAALMTAPTRVTNPVAPRELAAIPCDSASQKTVRKRKTGRPVGDDRPENGHKSATSGGRYKCKRQMLERNTKCASQRRRRQTDGDSLILESGDLQDYQTWHESQRYIREKSAPAAGLL